MLAVIVGLLAVLPVNGQAETIVVAADEWCPYNCEPGAVNPGYGIEVLEKVFSTHGHKIKYVTMPWKRALEDVESGAINAAIGVVPEESPGLVFPEEKVGWFEDGFFTTKPKWKYTGLKSLGSMTFGVAEGYSYGKVIDRMISQQQVKVEVMYGKTPLEFNMYKLRYGRIQGVIADRNVFNYVAKLRGTSHLYFYGGSASGGAPLYVAFSPNRETSREFARLYSEGVLKLRASGELQQILDKYGVKDWAVDE